MISIQHKVDWFSAYLALLLATTAALIVSLAIYIQAEKQIDRANAAREESLGISDQLRQTSLDLTSMARAYVVTGDAEYKDHFEQILRIRDGRAPWPSGDRNTFWELYGAGTENAASPPGAAVALLELARAAGFTARELQLLRLAKRRSDDLARVEDQAMGVIASGTTDAAVRAGAVGMLYDRNYLNARVGILGPIAEVDRMVDERTRASVNDAAEQAARMRVLVIAIGVLQVLLLWLTHRQLRSILGGTLRDVHETIDRFGRGDFAPVKSTSGDEHSVLGWLAASSTQLGKLALRQFKAIVDSSDDAIISKTPQGIITSWNPAAERMFGYTAAEAVGQSIELLLPEEAIDEKTQILARLARGEQLKHFETRRRRKDGSIVEISATISPILDADGRIVGAAKIARDISGLNQLAAELVRHRDNLEREVRQRTNELQVAKEAAEDANRAKSVFLATTSHELRTPLNAIIGFSSLMLEGMMGELSEEQRKALSIVRQAGQELLALVQDILDLSAIEAGNLRVGHDPVPLRALLEELCEAFQVQASEHGLDLRPVVCDPAVVVCADRARLAQVVRNLIGNAIKFTDRGFLQVRAERRGDSMWVAVEDSGIGIPLAEQHRLFQSFQRVVEPGGRLRAGTGLGLSICKRIVEAMGGEVGLESEAGRGSRFWFTVPLAVQPVVAEARSA